MCAEVFGGSWRTLTYPKKRFSTSVFEPSKVRIEGITKSNTMAGLLNNNFKKMVVEFFHVAAQTHPRA